MNHFTLLVGSTLGSAEDLADHLAQKLRDLGHQTVIHTSPQFDHILIEPGHYLLVVSSTHGAGDLPDNIASLYRQLGSEAVSLHRLQYGAVGLGDRSYDTFCHGIQKLDQRLRQLGAERIGSLLEIDVSLPDQPEDTAEIWLDQWLQDLGIPR
ncbi:FMN-binding protein MioC [Zobellella endophytica]|uniref:FMN-binding protein MioC n=1 Tax=Zobellella endophytica TaxID=2116700 RepID=A0A2P7QTA3_9GAMM|nr:FMN-binding protein MioC [Zobellella endophytica]PSJ41189.1 FMN-binding protein MioC [Zobellella endophytica]